MLGIYYSITFAVPKFWNIMLAVVKIAGQQFTVKSGDKLYVPRIDGKTGDKVEFLKFYWLIPMATLPLELRLRR